jgi:shikimate dehydrogenase
MRKFGLIGYPLTHSFSKQYFTEKFEIEHIPGCSYELYPIHEIRFLEKLLRDEPELCGLNVTIPYKSEVVKFLQTISPEAEEIGAVNVIKIKRESGLISLSGFNSDITGIMHSLKDCFSNNIGNALILGTGGSSKAVSYVLRKEGINVTLVSRERKADALAYNDLNQDIISKAGLIVNTTPLGMFPDVNTFPELNYDLLGPGHTLFDLVYNPQLTEFLRKGEERGCRIISGIIMLYAQAEKAWEIWNDNNL